MRHIAAWILCLAIALLYRPRSYSSVSSEIIFDNGEMGKEKTDENAVREETILISESFAANDKLIKLKDLKNISDEDYEKRIQDKRNAKKNQKFLQNKKRQNFYDVKKIIIAGLQDTCDWSVRPIEYLRGELCGTHYKVLGVNRHESLILDKASLKKIYRRLSLALHPDKNLSPDAPKAFKIVQDAYECLSNEECKKQFDQHLVSCEEKINLNRAEIRRTMFTSTMVSFQLLHHYTSVVANFIFKLGSNVWEWAGDLQIRLFGDDWQVGKPLLLLIFFWKGQLLLKLQLVAYLIVRINYEIAKSRGFI